MKKTTLIIVPRERFALAVRSLRSVIEHLQGTESVVYVDSASPRKIADELKSICETHNFTYIRRETYLSPNQARNVGLSKASTPYVVFMDNDIIVSPGWLATLETCADETGADVVAPLTCQKQPLHSEVHQAGGQIFDNFEAFLSGQKDEARLTDLHLLQGKPTSDAGTDRRLVECCEFHCVLVRRNVFDRLGPLDEKLLSTKEHIDFSLGVWTTGGQVMLEPKSIITYLFPDRSNPLQPDDWPYFLLRWSPEWQQKSLDHFKAKWDLADDPYFERRRNILDWRYREGVAKPILRNFPVIRYSYKLRALGQDMILPVLKYLGRKAVLRHAKHFSD